MLLKLLENNILNEKLVKTDKADIYLETSAYIVRDYLFHNLNNITRLY